MARTRDLEVRHLRAFVALSDHRTVTKAAQALGFAQSTVSEAILALERAAGTALVARGRGGRRAVLTPDGHSLLPHARAVLKAIAGAHAAIAGTASRSRSALRIAANESVATYMLPPVLDRLNRVWPGTTISVSVRSCAAIRRAVAAGKFDVGLMLESNPRSLPTEHIIRPKVPLVLFSAPQHPLVRFTTRPVDRRRLLPFPVLLTEAEGHFHAFVRRYFAAGGAEPHLVPTGTIEGVKRRVLRDTNALGLLPLYALEEEIRAGRVIPLTLRPALAPLRLDAVFAGDRTAYPLAGELIEELRRGRSQTDWTRSERTSRRRTALGSP
jgi:DNA-binding transcriptional LysR family regulator